MLALVVRKGLGAPSGRSNLGIPEITGEMDFKGKNKFSSSQTAVSRRKNWHFFWWVFSVDFSVSVGSWVGMLAETEEVVSEVSRSV